MDYLDTEPPYVSGFGQSCNPRTDVRQLRLEFCLHLQQPHVASEVFSMRA